MNYLPDVYNAISIIGSYNTISIILFIIFLGWFLLKMMKSGEETLR
jgi:flagellar biogenesis protein FliO